MKKTKKKWNNMNSHKHKIKSKPLRFKRLISLLCIPRFFDMVILVTCGPSCEIPTPTDVGTFGYYNFICGVRRSSTLIPFG